MLVVFLALSFPASGQITQEARALAAETSAKLSSAQTVHLKARHKLDPAIGLGNRLEQGPIEIVVARPNRFHAIQTAKEDTREIAFDGQTLVVMNPKRRYHAIAPLRAANIDEFADQVEKRFGFRPPVAEFLSVDFEKQLFRDVTSAKVVGTDWIGLTRCQHLQLVHDGMTADLWIADKDKHPRRCLLTFTGIEGDPTWDIRLSDWKLGAPVEEALFARRPASDSSEIPMLKSR